MAGLAALLLLVAGCGTVRPAEDYARAGALIGERTGTEHVYDPLGEDAYAARCSELLAGGLSADEAVQLALLNNRALQGRFQDIGVSKADLGQSALLSNPTLSFSTRFADIGGRANVSFGLAQELVDLWQIPVRKRIARDALDATILAVSESAIVLSAEVRSAYLEVCAQDALSALAAENVKQRQAAVELTQRRFDAGETTIMDVNLVRASVLEASMQLAMVQRDARVARGVLEHQLGLSLDQGGVEVIDALPEPGCPPDDERDLVQRALAERLDVRMASLGLDQAAHEVKLEIRRAVPSVTLGLDGERPDRANGQAPASLASQVAAINTALSAPSQALQDRILERIDGARQRKFDDSQAVGLLLGPSLQLTLPVFDQNRAQTAKARYLYVQKEKDYEELLLSVVEEVQTALANVRASGAVLRMVCAEGLPLAEQNLATAQRVYEAGEESIVALLLAQQNVDAQRAARLRSAADYGIALARLEQALGGKRVPDVQADKP